jgi:prolyl 4-hydroxylase
MSKTTQQVTAELRAWIVAQAQAGHAPETVLAAMRASGWDEDVALDALEETLRDFLAQRAQALAVASAPTEVLPPTVPVPAPSLHGSPNVLDVGDRSVSVLLSMSLPRVVVFGGLLSDGECDELIALASTRLERSHTVDNVSGGTEVNAARTSDGMFFGRGEFELCRRIEQRIARLVNWPVENGEGLQVLRYRPGAEYKAHHDYFDPVHPGSLPALKRGGQRVGTVVMYLNTPERGGATTFPDVGVEVEPIKGNAVFFSYDRAHPSTKTLHGGAPVVAGEKWVATKWLREGRFD